jgi:hypothetical protein
MNTQELAGLTDQELITGALRELQGLARQLMEPGKRDTVLTIIK